MPALITWLEAGLLAALAPIFIFPGISKTWPILIFPLLWVARWWLEETKYPSDRTTGAPLDAAIFVLTFQLLISFVSAGAWEAMLPKLLGILYGILVYFALARLLRTERLAQGGMTVFLLGGAALASFGLTGMFKTSELDFKIFIELLFNKIPRRDWAFQGAEEGLNPNAVAGVMLLFVPLCLLLLFLGRRKQNEAMGGVARIAVLGVLFALSFFFLFVLFLTQTVGAWIALITAVWIVLPSGKARLIGTVPAMVIIVVILFVLPYFQGEKESAEKAYWLKKVEARYDYWNAGIVAVKERPLTGVGVNLLRRRPELGGYEHSHAHNHMLHTAAELGIPGLIAYLAMLMIAGYMCRDVWRRAGPPWMKLAARGLAAGQAAHFIFGLGDSIPLGAKPGIFFWVSLALIAALYKRAKHPS